MKDHIQRRLADFLKNNPESEYQAENGRRVIARPWGEPTFELVVGEKDTELIDSLNALRLPPRLTALWHLDAKELEFIFTALPVRDELLGRSFELRFEGKSIQCGFGRGSQRLALVANAARFLAPPSPESPTAYRNLQFITMGQRGFRDEGETASSLQERITSFWVRNVDADENAVVELALHVNFYMRYYDHHSPQIALHQDYLEKAAAYEPVQYPYGPFPSIIAGRLLDSHLLNIWQGAATFASPFLRFLYYYQIIECAAARFLKDELYRKVKKLLVAPHTPSSPDEVVRQVVDLTACDKNPSESERMKLMVKEYVDPEPIWQEIQTNLPAFDTAVTFDGDFKLDPLVSKDCTLETFTTCVFPMLTDTYSDIRNALTHWRERKTKSLCEKG